jgi:hypothetical protein
MNLVYDYAQEQFNIYKYILSKEFYKSEISEYMPVELYRTVLYLALEMKKFKWTTPVY